MNVKELAAWLAAFEDQDAMIEVMVPGADGIYSSVEFDPDKHTGYIDFRGNKFVQPSSEWHNAHILLLGVDE